MFLVDKTENFMRESQLNGWKFFATTANGDSAQVTNPKSSGSPAAHDPVVLVMGNEDEGLPPWVVKQADGRLSIASENPSLKETGVDSLNVSVAAAVLCDRFLTRPKKGCG